VPSTAELALSTVGDTLLGPVTSDFPWVFDRLAVSPGPVAEPEDGLGWPPT
jgi:hypothetical protein